jgi:succinate-semialdehyde dehydrogenase / glutarate-semialdehyde dehydrogenase
VTDPSIAHPFVDGRPSQGRGRRLDVIDPASGAPFTAVSTSTVDDCLAAVDAAAIAFRDWAASPPRDRAEVLRRAHRLMVEERRRFVELIVTENGKASRDADAEVTYAAEFFRWYSEEACRIDGDVRRAPGGTNWMLTRRSPVGVAVLITPWNFPAAMITRKVAPALAAGCTTVIKPALETPLTALALADLLTRAGAPPGAVNVVMPDPPGDAVTAMLAHDEVRKLSFTGSTITGQHLLRIAAARVLNCSMELGGNAPFVVLPDADVSEAVAGALVAKMRNGGAACTAANRFYVHSSLVDEFTERFTKALAGLTVGDGHSTETDIGPLVSAAQRDRVDGLVATAVQHGATIHWSGQRPAGGGFFVAPSVLTDVAADNPVLGHEVFGPVAPIAAFDDHVDVVDWCNGTEAGLTAYVYGSLDRAMAFADRLEFAMIGVNRAMVSDPAAPFGGVRQSGIGREGGHDGLLAFTETRYVAVDW